MLQILLEVDDLLRCARVDNASCPERPYTEDSLAQNRHQFAFAVAGLRERLRSGAYVQGQALTVNDLAGAFGVSATPVREALAHLAGEGLVEDRRGSGYFAWRVDVSDLTDLYRAQETLTLAALGTLVRRAAGPVAPTNGWSPPPATTGTPVALGESAIDWLLFWEGLTSRVAREAGHRYLLGAQQRLADRLAPARRLEATVLLEGVDDLRGLADHVNRRAWGPLSIDILPFFARRCAAAGAIVDKLRVASLL